MGGSSPNAIELKSGSARSEISVFVVTIFFLCRRYRDAVATCKHRIPGSSREQQEALLGIGILGFVRGFSVGLPCLKIMIEQAQPLTYRGSRNSLFDHNQTQVTGFCLLRSPHVAVLPLASVFSIPSVSSLYQASLRVVCRRSSCTSPGKISASRDPTIHPSSPLSGSA